MKNTYNLYDFKNLKKVNHFTTKKYLIEALKDIVGELSAWIAKI